MSAHFKVVSVVGARPNFMKTAPILAQLKRRCDIFETYLVHTRQHYDSAMSQIFLEQLGVGPPDYLLDVGSGSHAVQTARAMEQIEPVLEALRPNIVLVPGDVNSTLAASLVAAKLGLPIGHIEAGLRSFDRAMPEEINRVLTDQLSDILFIHSPEARDNLIREGCDDAGIHYVGNTMIDALVTMRKQIETVDAAGKHGLRPAQYLVVTLHRPALVDGPQLGAVLDALEQVARELPVIFPVHPRTRRSIGDRRAKKACLQLIAPLGYIEFIGLIKQAAGVLTDSGGIQEETTFLGIPCFTLRTSTERPITCTHGTNKLLGLEPSRILEIPAQLFDGARPETQLPFGWDGAAAGRAVDVLEQELIEMKMSSRRCARIPPAIGTSGSLLAH